MAEKQKWAAIVPRADGAIDVFVHNWILAGTAKNADELWRLVHEAWDTPEKFWGLFYAQLGRPEKISVDPNLAHLSLEDLGL
jgi:hypothetical protein